jgi:dihydroorotase-like cyclic amidohydrolase
MPIAMPAVHTAAFLLQRAAHVQPRSIVDFALYAGAGDDNLDEIAAMAEAGAVAFKTFRTSATRGRENEFLGLCCPDAGQMLEAMTRTARTGLPHVVHAEDQQILTALEARFRAAGWHDGRTHARARPEIAEAASVAQCIAIAEATGARLQIAHMTSVAAIRMVRQAKDAGLRVTAETCPHYLMFTEDALAAWGPYAKCNPPLRSHETQDVLWEAVRSGIIDVIGTDHSPFLVEEKEPFRDNIWGATAGMPALEEYLPLMLTAVHQGRLTLAQVVRLTSENPARVFVLVDTRDSWVHDHRTLETRSRDTAVMYDGMRLRGRPVRTLVRGRTVMAGGAITGDPGWGQWIRPL